MPILYHQIDTLSKNNIINHLNANLIDKIHFIIKFINIKLQKI